MRIEEGDLKELDYDKKILSSKFNKDGLQLQIYRKLNSDEVGKGYFNNNAKYSIYTEDGQYVGYIEVTVSNTLEGDRAEVEACAGGEHTEGRGNITIGLEEALQDIFIDESFNNLPIRPRGAKSNIIVVFAAINDDNYASQTVAKKNGFSKNNYTGAYEITKSQFLNRQGQLNKERDSEQLKEDNEEQR